VLGEFLSPKAEGSTVGGVRVPLEPAEYEWRGLPGILGPCRFDRLRRTIGAHTAYDVNVAS